MKQTTKFMLLAIILLFASDFLFAQAVNTFYGAFTAKRGTGAYKGSIFWINWDINNDGRPGDVIADQVVRTINTPSGIKYTIKIIKNSTNLIRSYTPGVYPYDDIKTAYNWFKAIPTAGSTWQSWPGANYNFYTSPLTNAYDDIYDAHHSVIGIENTTDADLVDFTIQVSGTLPDGVTPVKIAGMVATGAESLAGSNNIDYPNYLEYERFVSLNGRAWQAFDRTQNVVKGAVGGVASTAFNTLVDVRTHGTDIIVHNPVGSTEGPGEIIWYSQGASSIRTYLKGEGHEAVAIGFLPSYDYGDAPQVYGVAGHEVSTDFTGGYPADTTIAVSRNVPLANMTLATVTPPRLIIGLIKDMGGIQWSTPDAKGDDTHDLADEDAIPNPYSTNIVAGSASVSIPVNIINRFTTGAQFTGWIDVNKDSIFQPNEAATMINIPAATSATSPYQGINTLNFTLPSSIKAFTNYFTRLRVTQSFPASGTTANGTDVRAVGIQYQGEVEDHIIRAQGVPVSGNIFLDNNMNSIYDSGEALYGGTNTLFVYALDRNGNIVIKDTVQDGKFLLPDFFVGDSTSSNIRIMVSTQDYSINTTPSSITGSAPVPYLISGEDLSKLNPTTAIVSSGTSTKDFLVKVNNVPPGGLTNLNFGMYDRVLPVTFGKFEAKISEGFLFVNWTTEDETNNDHFDIELSGDGKIFTKAGSVITKAANGNSSQSLNYEFNIPLSSAKSLLGISFLGLALLAGSSLKRRRSLWMIILFGLSAITFFNSSCNKKEVDALGRNEKIYIRIVQVDKDGSQKISKVIEAIHE